MLLKLFPPSVDEDEQEPKELQETQPKELQQPQKEKEKQQLVFS